MRSFISQFCLAMSLVLVSSGILNAQIKLDLNDVSWLWPAPASNSDLSRIVSVGDLKSSDGEDVWADSQFQDLLKACLLYTSPSPRDQRGSRMPSSA